MRREEEISDMKFTPVVRFDFEFGQAEGMNYLVAFKERDTFSNAVCDEFHDDFLLLLRR
jgi:hypothetical protein